MPTQVGDTPLGGTISLGTQGGSYNFLSITGVRETGVAINATHLGTTNFAEFLQGDLKTVDAVTVRVQFVGIDGLPNILAASETITITWPNNDTTAANYAGSGFLTEREFAAMDIASVEDLMVAEFILRYNGGYGGTTEPSFTLAT
jgi:hypothetical protein